MAQLTVPAMGFGHVERLVPGAAHSYALVLPLATVVATAPSTLAGDVREWIAIWADEPPTDARRARLAARVAAKGSDWTLWETDLVGDFLAAMYGHEVLTEIASETPRRRPFVGVQTLDDWRVTRGHVGLFGRALLYP